MIQYRRVQGSKEINPLPFRPFLADHGIDGPDRPNPEPDSAAALQFPQMIANSAIAR